MDFGMGSGDEQETSNSRGKRSYHRHSATQIDRLETFFKECPHPDEKQRRMLSNELGLQPKQIKFWFQNKRTQIKTQNERAGNSALRAENERIQCENFTMREKLKNIICPNCGGPPSGEKERQLSLQNLQLENAQLREEHDKVSNLVAKHIGRPISQFDMISTGSSMDLFPPNYLPNGQENIPLPYLLKGISEMEKTLMVKSATSAMDELIKLFQVNEPLWINSSSSDTTYVIHPDNYHKIFPKTPHFKTSSARIESSKDSGMVTINAFELVNMFMDSNKWKDLFPTIITRARTIQMIQNGKPETRSGCLELMHEQLHILSPLAPSREFYLLRYCQQIEHGIWVIVDFSYDCFKEKTNPSRCWKLPSGCMIQDMSNGCCKVTWIEHVEVDDKSQTHRLYRDLICGSNAYGAERWIVNLQRMCQRLIFYNAETIAPAHQLGGGKCTVITSSEGRRSIMKLGHRMVKDFGGILSMSGKLDFPQLSEVNNSGVRVSVRQSLEFGQPNGMIVSATTSLWLPLSPQIVFSFLIDVKMRPQWDILSNGNPIHEIVHISNGAPGNFISIIRPFIPTENNMLIVEESCTDPSGSLVVYAPIDVPAVNAAIRGEDSSSIPILPSGFIISSDGRENMRIGSSSNANAQTTLGGSLLTVAFQVLAHSSSNQLINMEYIASLNTLISNTVQKIRVALNCSNYD